MLFVDNLEHTDPRVNLATETFLLQELKIEEPILLFYINEPSIIIGRNQNTIEEINQTYVDENNIHVVRRLSGGGAVYHDFGNLSFSFIMPDEGDSFRNFAKFTQPVVDALHQLGVDGAELKGRNDLVIDDKKFSGNAMLAMGGRMFAHGTIMFDSDIEAVVHALKVKQDKIASKGIKSIRSRVTNIKPYLPDKYQQMTTREFRDLLLLTIFEVSSAEQVKQYQLTKEDWQKVKKIEDRLYDNWDWNYGKSPKYTLEKRHRFPIGSIEFRFNVEDGKIEGVKIYGDFFGLGEITDIEEKLVGVKFDRDDLRAALSTVDLKHYFGDITVDDILAVIAP